MKFGAGSNNELTQKYEKVKAQKDICTSKHTYKQTYIPDFQLCYPCKCLLTTLARQIIIQLHVVSLVMHTTVAVVTALD